MRKIPPIRPRSAFVDRDGFLTQWAIRHLEELGRETDVTTSAASDDVLSPISAMGSDMRATGGDALPVVAYAAMVDQLAPVWACNVIEGLDPL